MVNPEVLERMREQLAGERPAAGSPVAQVAGRAVRLVLDRAPGADESALPADCQRVLTAVRQTALLPLSSATSDCLADLVRGHRKKIRSPRPASQRAPSTPELASQCHLTRPLATRALATPSRRGPS
ncbi:hypothetical protein ABR737_38230 [Streptomyces sp. Edi2]|uniref:hypothetical protein n=1 Tax=Streptomyces sp. Edi2 TaxID=3162528 RepID=UPI0033059F2D